MNVTVVVPKPLQRAFQGRSKIELGVPKNSDVADVLDTLLTLYPKLREFVASESRPRQEVYFALQQRGHTLYLVSATNKPIAA